MLYRPLRLLGLLLVMAALTSGCGSFVRIQNMDKLAPDMRDKVDQVVVFAEGEDASVYDIQKGPTTTGYSCKNKIWDPDATVSAAVNQLRYWAADAGYNGVIVTSCTSGGEDYSKNCWNWVSCQGQMAKVVRFTDTYDQLAAQQWEQIFMSHDNVDNAIEGVWSFTDNSFRVVIVPVNSDAGIDYKAVVLDSKKPGWKVGDVMMHIRSTAADSAYRVRAARPDGVAFDTTLILKDKGNLLDLRINMPGSSELLRDFPREVRLGKRPVPDSLAEGERPEQTARADDDEGKIVYAGSGTGWVAPQGYVVTNAHVVDGGDYFVAYNVKTEEDIVLTLKTRDDANDIALLVPANKDDICKLPPAIALATTPPYMGQEVFTVGYPMFGAYKAATPQFTTGIVSALDGIGGDRRYIQMTVPIQPGNSGGPLVSNKGEVVGLTTSSVNDMHSITQHGTVMQNMNFSIKTSYLRALLENMPAQTNCNGIRKGANENINKLGAVFTETSLLIKVFNQR